MECWIRATLASKQSCDTAKSLEQSLHRDQIHYFLAMEQAVACTHTSRRRDPIPWLETGTHEASDSPVCRVWRLPCCGPSRTSRRRTVVDFRQGLHLPDSEME